MEKLDRDGKDETQKAKLIFLSIAAVVIILLIWSFYTANKARVERDKAVQEVEMLKQDSAKLEQMLKEQNQVNEELKKKVQICESKPKAKAAAKKTAAPKKAKKTAKSKKHT
jgi:uncharacterized membrane protein YhiD involved in acid resistance